MAKTARILKLIDGKAVLSFKPWKSQFFTNFIVSYIYNLQLLQFWSIIVVPSGIKSGPDNEFQSLGSQKTDFFCFGEKVDFLMENR